MECNIRAWMARWVYLSHSFVFPSLSVRFERQRSHLCRLESGNKRATIVFMRCLLTKLMNTACCQYRYYSGWGLTSCVCWEYFRFACCHCANTAIVFVFFWFAFFIHIYADRIFGLFFLWNRIPKNIGFSYIYKLVRCESDVRRHLIRLLNWQKTIINNERWSRLLHCKCK